MKSKESLFFSICIPAYQRVHSLKRLLDSIAEQSFRDFEVVVTDDSPSDSVRQLCDQYKDQFPLHYFKNPQALGTPENWNEGIRKSKGEWIKLMHDDDWFSDEDSLEQFADAIQANPDADFFFSAYCSIHEKTGKEKHMFTSRIRLHHIHQNPAILLSKNSIGPPSVTAFRNTGEWFYDTHLKWLVDIEFYIRFISTKKFCYVHPPLVNIGINAQQVTQSSFRVANVEIPEYFYLLQKIGTDQLKNIAVFDAWWRLLRNLKITDIKMIREAGYHGEIPDPIRKIISFQRTIPNSVLKNGFVSKSLMSTCFLFAG
jgi:glycosyltransferase involved in cell wall biosynthesis